MFTSCCNVRDNIKVNSMSELTIKKIQQNITTWTPTIFDKKCKEINKTIDNGQTEVLIDSFQRY